MIKELIDNKEVYKGKEILVDNNRIQMVGVDEVIVTNDETKILMTNDIHFCICLLVIGETEVGMAHINILEKLNSEQHSLLKKLLDIKKIRETYAFVGPKTSIESLNEVNEYIPCNNYTSYINNPLGIDVATGNIAYNIKDKELYGYNDDGFVEYKKGYINALNSDELVKKY